MGANNCGIISSYGDTDLLRNDALAIRLDDLVDSAAFIKIDAEGHDYPVLLGAQRLLAEERPVVMVEYNQSNFDMSGFTAENISTLFTEHKYTVVGRHAGDYIYVPIEKVPEGLNKIMSKVVSTGKNNFVVMDVI